MAARFAVTPAISISASRACRANRCWAPSPTWRSRGARPVPPDRRGRPTSSRRSATTRTPTRSCGSGSGDRRPSTTSMRWPGGSSPRSGGCDLPLQAAPARWRPTHTHDGPAWSRLREASAAPRRQSPGIRRRHPAAAVPRAEGVGHRAKGGCRLRLSWPSGTGPCGGHSVWTCVAWALRRLVVRNPPPHDCRRGAAVRHDNGQHRGGRRGQRSR